MENGWYYSNIPSYKHLIVAIKDDKPIAFINKDKYIVDLNCAYDFPKKQSEIQHSQQGNWGNDLTGYMYLIELLGTHQLSYFKQVTKDFTIYLSPFEVPEIEPNSLAFLDIF